MGWAGFNLLTVDVAYYQGNYHADGNVYGVIVNVARLNQGGYQETTYGARQIANARADGKGVGFYIFNGNQNAYTAGILFAQTCIRMGFNPKTDVIAIDCEDEGSTGTHAWGPGECSDFMNGFNTVLRLAWSSVLVYMNYTVNRRFDWSGVAGAGARLWYARPDGPLDQKFWASVTMKQDGLYNGVDADGHNAPFPEIVGGSSPTTDVIEEDDDMTKPLLAHYTDPADNVERWIQFLPGTSWFLEWQDLDGAPIASGFAQQQDVVRNGTPITKSMRDAIKAEADDMKASA